MLATTVVLRMTSFVPLLMDLRLFSPLLIITMDNTYKLQGVLLAKAITHLYTCKQTHEFTSAVA